MQKAKVKHVRLYYWCCPGVMQELFRKLVFSFYRNGSLRRVLKDTVELKDFTDCVPYQTASYNLLTEVTVIFMTF